MKKLIAAVFIVGFATVGISETIRQKGNFNTPANGGTGTSTAFTAGSVVFSGSSGVYAQNNASFFWDNTNTRLGLGYAVPASTLDVFGSAQFGSAATISTFSAAGVLLMGNQQVTFARTKAQIDALVPSAVGAVITCSNCSVPYVICTATGTLAAQWVAMKTGNGCGTNN